MRVAITANGPGEFAGWLRPLVAALLARDPATEIHVFAVPDDFATGNEATYLTALFPGVRVHDTAAYVRTALGGTAEGVPDRVDRVLYLGGDLGHAARLHARLGGIAHAYKFARKKYDGFARVYAVDEANRAQLEGWGVPSRRIRLVGNLAIDGALGEAAGRFAVAGGAGDADAAQDGVVLFPGSRKAEVENAFPMFVRLAVNLRRRLPGVPIAFAGSPFVDDDTLRTALARGGATPLAYGLSAALGDGAIVADGQSFPLVRNAMRTAANARLAIAIPGTKVIELAALGVPAVVTTPLNAPELVVIGGPMQYVGKIPRLGPLLKRTAVAALAKRFAYFAQPNIDAGREIDPEVAGTVLPSQVAHVAAERWNDAAWCKLTGAELAALYRHHAGAADRVAAFLLEPA